MLKRMIDSVRRNHALEHATITILLKKHGQTRVVGRAARDGFYIYGNVPAERLEEFAHEALERLKGGESHLAVSPLCGTNLAVAGVLAGLGSYVSMSARSDRINGLPGAIIASIAAVIAAQPLGRWVQKHYTTLPDLEGVEIVSVRNLRHGPASVHKVQTRAVS